MVVMCDDHCSTDVDRGVFHCCLICKINNQLLVQCPPLSKIVDVWISKVFSHMPKLIYRNPVVLQCNPVCPATPGNPFIVHQKKAIISFEVHVHKCGAEH